MKKKMSYPRQWTVIIEVSENEAGKLSVTSEERGCKQKGGNEYPKVDTEALKKMFHDVIDGMDF